MSKQLQWAIGGLALLIVGFVALQIYLHVDMKQFKEELADPEPKTETETEQPTEHVQVPELYNRPPHPDDGHEYEWHGNHWDRVDQLHGQSALVPKTYDGPLTYHAELLESNPVKALRLQTEERGHWSAKWIPPFPPDDLEATAIARNIYLMTYYESIGDITNPIFIQAWKNHSARRKADHVKFAELNERLDTFTIEDRVPPSEVYKQFLWENARLTDLIKLTWGRGTLDENILRPKRQRSNFPLPK